MRLRLFAAGLLAIFDCVCLWAVGTPATSSANSLVYHNGALYGTTETGGAAGYGSVVQLTPPAVSGDPWTLTVLYSFLGAGDGSAPQANLVFDGNGALYGDTRAGGIKNNGTVFQLVPPSVAGGAWTPAVLHRFRGHPDAANPTTAPILDDKGALYGTTPFGGVDGKGAVFRLKPPATAGAPWKETVIYSFTGGTDGSSPWGDLLFDTSGTLYGATKVGGATGTGTAFTLTPPLSGPKWTEEVIYNFYGANGAVPAAGMVFDNNGYLYGTCTRGGTGDAGVVFQLAPPSTPGNPWTENVLYDFVNSPDADYPNSDLVFDASGALYGTSTAGGDAACKRGCGTVFQVVPPAVPGNPWTETLLYVPNGQPGALTPMGVVFDNNGILCGATLGAHETVKYRGFDGHVFTLTPPTTPGGAWTENTIFSFATQ